MLRSTFAKAGMSKHQTREVAPFPIKVQFLSDERTTAGWFRLGRSWSLTRKMFSIVGILRRVYKTRLREKRF